MEAYIKTELDLDGVAHVLRAAVNAASENQTSYQREQRRESANYDGLYYLIEVFGLTLTLVRNSGEAAIDERAEWPYYIIVSSNAALADGGRSMAEHLATLLRAQEGLEVTVDDLGA